MRLTFCDRCGEPVPNPLEWNTIYVPKGGSFSSIEDLLLCPKCYQATLDFAYVAKRAEEAKDKNGTR